MVSQKALTFRRFEPASLQSMIKLLSLLAMEENLQSMVEPSFAPKAVETMLHCLRPAIWFIFDKPQCHKPKVIGSTLAVGR